MGLRYTVWIHTTITNPTSWIYFIVFLSQYPKKYSEYTNKNYVKMLPWPLVSTPKAFSPEPNSPEYSLEGLLLKLNANSLATWCEQLTHSKTTWCWERLNVGEGANRGWDSWMASLTRWTWVWVNFGSLWWTGKPGLLQSMGSQSGTLLSDWTELLHHSA